MLPAHQVPQVTNLRLQQDTILCHKLPETTTFRSSEFLRKLSKFMLPKWNSGLRKCRFCNIAFQAVVRAGLLPAHYVPQVTNLRLQQDIILCYKNLRFDISSYIKSLASIPFASIASFALKLIPLASFALSNSGLRKCRSLNVAHRSPFCLIVL